MSGREDFLSRWARRKGAHRRREAARATGAARGASTGPADTPEGAGPDADGPRGSAPAGEADAPPREIPPLPDIDELAANSDYTAFLADGVPESLARAALRKLWRSDPVLANLDGLNDYDEDFTLGAGMTGAVERLVGNQAGGEPATDPSGTNGPHDPVDRAASPPRTPGAAGAGAGEAEETPAVEGPVPGKGLGEEEDSAGASGGVALEGRTGGPGA